MKKLVFTAFAVGLGLAVNLWAQVPSYVPTNGLVGWWPFNGNANDESGNGNNGTVNGATLTTDRFGNTGNAYSFDGVDDFISVPDSPILELGNSYSIGVWINFTSNPLNEFTAISKERQLDGTGLAIIIDNTAKVAHGFINGANYSFYSLNSLSFARWNYVVITYDGLSAKLFLDGVSNNSSNFSQSLINSTLNWYFGKEFTTNGGGSSGYTNRYFDGKIDDIGIWNRALTDQEISDLYNANICYEHVTVTDTLVINTGITGYNPITYKNTLKIWPNPTNDHITIDAGNLTTMNGYSIKIEDAQGQQVFQNAVNQQQFYVDITNWGGNGLYFVRIIDPQGNTVDIKKIVLQ